MRFWDRSTHNFIKRDESAACIFTPSNCLCYNLYPIYTMGCPCTKQPYDGDWNLHNGISIYVFVLHLGTSCLCCKQHCNKGTKIYRSTSEYSADYVLSSIVTQSCAFNKKQKTIKCFSTHLFQWGKFITSTISAHTACKKKRYVNAKM